MAHIRQSGPDSGLGCLSGKRLSNFFSFAQFARQRDCRGFWRTREGNKLKDLKDAALKNCSSHGHKKMLEPRPSYRRDWLMCAKFARQRTLGPQLARAIPQIRYEGGREWEREGQRRVREEGRDISREGGSGPFNFSLLSCLKNGSSHGQNMAATGLCVPNSLGSGPVEPCCPAPEFPARHPEFRIGS